MSGLECTLTAMQAHLTAVAWPRYEVRLIDTVRRACCASRSWTAAQLLSPSTAGFLRAGNRQGCEVYFRPHAGPRSVGYLLLDFDAGPCPWWLCGRPIILPASWSRPVADISKLGSASAPKRSGRVGPPQPHVTWRHATVPIWPALSGGIWGVWRVSPIAKLADAKTSKGKATSR
jgi:hypothetical protein